MTSMNEPAGTWVRVSTADQSEDSQVPDIERHCAAHNYRIVKRYELNDISASKGEQQAKLDAMLEDMREGHIRVLVCWHSDRVERRGPEALFRLLRQIKDASGRIESTKEPLLGTEDLSGEAVTALNAVISHQYSVHLGEQVKIALDRIKANGGIYNNVPWGFTIEGDKYEKRIVPTELCRRIVPQIFGRCIAGESLRSIAAWLDSEGIPTPKGRAHWNESTVRWTIRQRAYAGRLTNRQGQTIARCEAVVSAAVFDRANQALKTRPHRGPVKNDPPMLANLRCARCGSSMYRIKAGSTKKRYYYRCFGNGPQRKGCGNMVPLATADTIVTIHIFTTSTKPYRTREWVEGESFEDEISNVKQDLREAVEAERWADMPALQATLDELRDKQEHATKGRYQYFDTGITEGQHFLELDRDQKREFLRGYDIRVERFGVHKEDFRVVIDGESTYWVVVGNKYMPIAEPRL